MGYTRKSSRGNPYHDERGRFTTADGCSKKVDWKTEYNYAVQTAQRKRALNPPPKVTAYVVDNGETKEVYGNEVQKGMIVEYDPAWATPGNEKDEEKYLFVIRDANIDDKGKGWADIVCLNGKTSFATIQRVDAESIRPASTEKVDRTDAAMSDAERRKMANACGWNRNKINTASDVANYMSRKMGADSVKVIGGNVLEMKCGGETVSGYLHVKDGVGYIKPIYGKKSEAEYVTVDRYISTREYLDRYDYIIDRHDTKDFTEITGSIGGDVERVRIHNDGSVGAK